MSRLALILKFQAVVFAGYSVLFLLAPDWTVDTVFGWADQPTLWVRAVGVPFAGLAWAGWLVANRLETRLDLVWPLALVPGLFVAAFTWERTVGVYEGTESFFWVSIAVTTFFVLTVGGLRLSAEQESTPTFTND
jgi:hypothetical protein